MAFFFFFLKQAPSDLHHLFSPLDPVYLFSHNSISLLSVAVILLKKVVYTRCLQFPLLSWIHSIDSCSYLTAEPAFIKVVSGMLVCSCGLWPMTEWHRVLMATPCLEAGWTLCVIYTPISLWDQTEACLWGNLILAWLFLLLPVFPFS